MRKFLLPIINLVNVILVSITFGIAAKNAATSLGANLGNYYWLVWMPGKTHANVIGIVGFFLFCVAAFLMLVNFLPIKVRKFIALLTGAMFIAAGVIFLKTPNGIDRVLVDLELSGTLIAMSVLTIIAGAFSLLMGVIDLLPSKAKAE